MMYFDEYSDTPIDWEDIVIPEVIVGDVEIGHTMIGRNLFQELLDE